MELDMAEPIITRIPVVGGVAYMAHVTKLPATFEATLQVEPDNRYFRHAIAVRGAGEKVGYIAPEIAVRYFDAVKAHGAAVTCPARRATRSDHETSGVEVLLDFTSLPVQPAE